MSEYDRKDESRNGDGRRDEEGSRSRRKRRERSRRRERDEGGERGEEDRRQRSKDRRRSKKKKKSRSGSRSRRRRRQLPGLWDSMEPVQNQSVIESMLMGDPKTRECYIGHLPPGANPRMLEDLFNSLFQLLPEYKAKYGENQPVITAQMYGNGTFAFVEFRSKQVAQTAIKFDQVVLLNHPLHIGRPQGFVPPPPGQEAPILDISPLLQAGLIPAPQQIAGLPPMMPGMGMMGQPMMGQPMMGQPPPMIMGGAPMGGPPMMGGMQGMGKGGPVHA